MRSPSAVDRRARRARGRHRVRSHAARGVRAMRVVWFIRSASSSPRLVRRRRRRRRASMRREVWLIHSLLG